MSVFSETAYRRNNPWFSTLNRIQIHPISQKWGRHFLPPVIKIYFTPDVFAKTILQIKLWTLSKRTGFPEILGQSWREIGREKTTLAWFVKFLPFARMDCIIPWFTVSCSRCAAPRDLLRLGYISSDSVKNKGASCVQGIKYAAQNRQKRKKPCAAFNTQHRAFLCCRWQGTADCPALDNQYGVVIDFWLHLHRCFSCHALCKVVI